MTRVVGFVANFHLTPTLLAVARDIERDGLARVHWFAFSRRWSRWLEASGVPVERIVLLSGDGSDPSVDELGALEQVRLADEPPIHDLIASDRVLSRQAPERALQAVSSVVTAFKAEVLDRHVELLFGESTWTVEVALAYAARSVGVSYLSPISARVPAGRIGFAPAPLQERFIDLGSLPGEDASALALAALTSLERRDGPPLWSHNRFSVDRYLRQPGLMADKLRDAIFDSRDNPTQLSLGGYWATKNAFSLARSSRRLHRIMEGALTAPAEVGAPFFLMPLQVQPEASVDVLAWRSRDQLENVRLAAQCVPPGMVVAVKEHSHRFGSRGEEFYKHLGTIPNVVLVDPFGDAGPWMQAAEAVLAPSGTMCLENALVGRRSVVLAPMYFTALPTVRRLDLSSTTEVSDFLQMELPLDHRESSLHFLHSIVSSTRPGTFAAERDISSVLAADNVHSLSAAFRRAIEVELESA